VILALSEYPEDYPDRQSLLEVARLLTEAQKRVLQLERPGNIGGEKVSA
jgi:hypothetical protein